MSIISWNKRSEFNFIVPLWLILTLLVIAFIAHAVRLRINLTPSMPRGFYRLVPGKPVKGDLVSFCLHGKFADLARKRGYLQAGSCSNGLRPLLKRLVAMPGDSIQIKTLNIHLVDSQGLPMPSILESCVVPPGMALVLAKHDGSFDSRYFGLVPLESLQRVEPLLVFNLQGE